MKWSQSGQIMRKRQKMVVMALILGAMVLIPSYQMSLTMFIITGVGYLWALREGLNGHEWFLIPIPGMMLSLGFSLFGMLLPVSIWWSSIYAVIFGLSHYFLMLTQNIFSVAAIRTIGLYRAAMAVGFVMTITSAFLLINTLLTFKQEYYINGVVTVLICFLLLVPALWSVKLTDKVSREVWDLSGFLSLYIGIFAMAISFWPAPTTIASIFLTTVMYVYLGLTQHLLADRLNKRNALEYLSFGIVVLVTMLVTTW